MNKAILLCASIGWQTIYDEKGRPKARHIGVSVSWMPYEISHKRCGFNHCISGEYANLMRREPQWTEIMVDHIARCFTIAAAKLMIQNHAEPSDMSEACDELRRGLTEGFRSFLENDKIWIHHFNQVLNVPKGSRYRTEDGEWCTTRKVISTSSTQTTAICGVQKTAGGTSGKSAEAVGSS